MYCMWLSRWEVYHDKIYDYNIFYLKKISINNLSKDILIKKKTVIAAISTWIIQYFAVKFQVEHEVFLLYIYVMNCLCLKNHIFYIIGVYIENKTTINISG